MNEQHQSWEEQLVAGLGKAPAPDFKAWCDKHSGEVALLQERSPENVTSRKRSTDRRMMMTSIKWITAAIVLMTGVVWINWESQSPATSLFADDIPGIDRVREMTWTVTFFVKYETEDGKESWIETEQAQFAYQHPHKIRETRVNSAGKIQFVNITDYSVGKTLSINSRDKKATLKTADARWDPRGPFAWVGEELRTRRLGEGTRVKSVSLQGETQLDDRSTNVVRVVLQELESGNLSQHDLYFDQNSKQLAGIWGPNDPALERSDVLSQVKTSGKSWYRMTPIASLTHNFNLDPELKPEELSLNAPAGYTIENIATPTVTEEEMIAYLEAAVRFNGDEFPDSPDSLYDRDQLNLEWEKPEAERSEAANHLISQVNKIRLREIYEPAIKRFISDNTVAGSFRYVGAGVKKGESDRLVLWYQLRNSEAWRAMYGDFKVRSVEKPDLPFQLEN